MTFKTPSSEREYLSHVDGLRGLAVMSVFLYHLGVPLLPGGFVGVDIFFVISGFLISRLIKEELDKTGLLDYRAFFVRRFLRLFPAYLLVMIFTLMFSALTFSPSALERFGGALVYSILGIANNFFWLEADYFDIASKAKPTLHTWSLSVEEQFYIFWPVLFSFVYRAGHSNKLIYFIFLVGSLSLLLNFSFADGRVDFVSNYLPFLEDLFSNGKSTIFYLLPFRVFEFAIGALLVWCRPSYFSRFFSADFYFVVGLLLVLLSCLFFRESIVFPYFYALIPCLGAVFLIVSGGGRLSRAALGNRVSIFLGKISYSLYLIHWPFIVFFLYVNGEMLYWHKFLVLILSLALAYLSYRYVETPFRYGGRHKVWSYLAVLGTAICIISGLHIKENKGWPWRVNSIVNFEDVGSSSDFHRAFYGGAGYPSYGALSPYGKGVDVVLMGDSHGRHYADGLYLRYANIKKLNLHIAAGTSCFHLPDFTRITQGSDWDRVCPQAFNTAIRMIRSAEKPPLVVMSHSWVKQISRADRLVQGVRSHKPVSIDDLILSIHNFKAMIGDAELVVVGEVPKAGVNLYDVLSRPRVLFFTNSDVEQYLFSIADKKLIEFNRSLREASEVSGDFTFYDPFSILCNAERCKNLDSERRLIYSDAGHLSKYGSRYVIDDMVSKKILP